MDRVNSIEYVTARRDEARELLNKVSTVYSMIKSRDVDIDHIRKVREDVRAMRENLRKCSEGRDVR